MITYKEFEEIVVDILKRDISSNHDQKKAILSKSDQSQFIVAGPGSGKTTVMVLKILKYIFVDDVHPHEILATTFTRKAADEMYSRILGWGDEMKTHLQDKLSKGFEGLENLDKITQINKIDFNQITIGTTDSIAEEIMRVHKEPGENQPEVIEDFVAKSAMMNILLKDNRYLNENLKEYLKDLKGKEKLEEPSQISEIILEIKNRIYYDQVDINELYEKVGENSGLEITLDCITDYEKELQKRNIIDFTMLEAKFLNKLKSGDLNIFLRDVKVILIDEYQDTNLIQEDIYFTIAHSAIKNNGSITVVGDDDQSLYRFRGATVDLFTNFKKRGEDKLNINIEEINLKTNYRSSENIINHCNQFAELDNEYQNARVANKPKIISPDFDKEKMPILGMFRNNPQILAKDLSRLINDLVNKGESELKILKVLDKDFFEKLDGNISLAELQKLRMEKERAGKSLDKIKLKLDGELGSASDIAVLSYSPKEMNNGNPTFLYYLRKNLRKLRQPIEIFNPRGIDLQDIPEVSVFCGLILECIDPEGKIQKTDKQIPNLAKKNITKWRYAAKDFIKMNPEPHKPITLPDFVINWQNRIPRGYNNWPNSASLMELAYKLITWIEVLQEDVEGVVYLEAITQSITQTGFFNKYSSNISFKTKEDEHASVLEAIWNIFIPLATGGVKIDEGLLETLPDDRINIMSIHQSKGLEFPLVIVDVGTKFKKNLVSNQRLRFPKSLPDTPTIEDMIRKHSKLGDSRRSEKDKSFDDLTRLYFVAFSRAENVLLLVGLNSAIEGYPSKNKQMKIPNVALGWSRNEKYVGFKEIYLV